MCVRDPAAVEQAFRDVEAQGPPRLLGPVGERHGTIRIVRRDHPGQPAVSGHHALGVRPALDDGHGSLVGRPGERNVAARHQRRAEVHQGPALP